MTTLGSGFPAPLPSSPRASTLVVLLAALSLAGASRSAAEEAADTPASPARSIAALRTDRAPRIDGIPEAEEWNEAPAGGPLLQVEPVPGTRSSKYFRISTGYVLNRVRLPEGDFDTRLASARVQVNFTPQLVWSTLVQYDDLSESIGINSRLHWEFRPGANIFLVLTQDTDRNDGRPRVSRTQLATKIGVSVQF